MSILITNKLYGYIRRMEIYSFEEKRRRSIHLDNSQRFYY